jgi:galactofuranosylgalactofuranosylrhamnosyl-N-acetylglucosaminyl-diphospho-decaprenol beta-1,5/1,6-galactofuranosyltransferase
MQTARVIISRVLRYLLEMRYGLAATTLKAVEDFLKGPDFLHDGGASAAREIHALRANYPDTVMHKVSEVPGFKSGEVQMVHAGPEPSRNRLVLLKRLLYLALGRTASQVVAVAKKDALWWHISKFDTVVVTDGSQSGVRLRSRDRDQTVKLAKDTARLAKRVMSDLPRLRAEYRAAVPDLTSRDNWRRLYDL